jgi:hypothetical protein
MSNESTSNLLSAPPRLWIGESKEEYRAMRDELAEEIKPTGYIERRYVEDLAKLVWDICRLRRLETAFVQNARPRAIVTLVDRLLKKLNYPEVETLADANKLALAWFKDDKAKVEVIKLLQTFQLDESAIDAEAYLSVFSGIQELNKMLAVAEARYSKTLRAIIDYRQAFGLRAKSTSDRIIANSDLARIEPANDSAA